MVWRTVIVGWCRVELAVTGESAGALHDVLDTYGIPNTFEVYAGTHTSHVAVRFQNHVMTFFGRNLCSRADCQ